jgi:hypothetical protein
VREQIGKSALDALARSLPDDRRPWSEVQVDWERAADHFASDANRADLESGRVALKSMVADEVATAEHPPKSWKDLAEAERAPWLVHEMQEATDLIRDGKVSWWDSTDADPPAHHRLVELGFAAVPALLAALDDARLTRMVDSREPSRTGGCTTGSTSRTSCASATSRGRRSTGSPAGSSRRTRREWRPPGDEAPEAPERPRGTPASERWGKPGPSPTPFGEGRGTHSRWQSA